MGTEHKPSMSILLLAALAATMDAQRVFEQADKVFYKGANKQQTNLGVGFNPILTADGNVVFIRGRHFDYGEKFDCAHATTKNWIAKYDPETGQETKLFDRVIRFYGPQSMAFCIFSQMQLSHDGSTLYLLADTDATGASLAIIKPGDGSMIFLHGIEAVWVIESGPHMDELIYRHRVLDMPAAIIRYPLVHARADGGQIKEISEEWQFEGARRAPILRKYLREINATIHVNGHELP
jgi:hypothetical protein